MIDESAIRERAYALWEKDACPEGDEKFYWYLAREQLQVHLHVQALVHAQVPDVHDGDFYSVKSSTRLAALPSAGDMYEDTTT